MPRATRVIYVENDPALRGMMTKLLSTSDRVEIVLSVASSDDALDYPDLATVDVALLDLALGDDSLNGIELGLALRERNSNMGIVLYSQHVVPDYLSNLPERYRWGWSFIEKRGDIEVDFLIEVLKSTALGLNVVDPNVQLARQHSPESPIDQLTVRQRQIMALAAKGMDAPTIAAELHIAANSVRQELSKAYAVLVPNPTPGTDLRTSAVLKYLRETRRYADSDEGT